MMMHTNPAPVSPIVSVEVQTFSARGDCLAIPYAGPSAGKASDVASRVLSGSRVDPGSPVATVVTITDREDGSREVLEEAVSRD